jgi:hypothetical protein
VTAACLCIGLLPETLVCPLSVLIDRLSRREFEANRPRSARNTTASASRRLEPAGEEAEEEAPRPTQTPDEGLGADRSPCRTDAQAASAAALKERLY